MGYPDIRQVPDLGVDGVLEFIADITYGEIEIGDYIVELIVTDTVTGKPGVSNFIHFEVLEYAEYLRLIDAVLEGNEAIRNGSDLSDEFSLTYSGDSDSC